MSDDGDYDRDTGPEAYEHAALSPPWRELRGWYIQRDHSRCDVRPRWSEEYGPTSPRTGRAVSYAQAYREYLEGRAGGGLWDYDTEREMALVSNAMRLMLRRSRARQRRLRVRNAPRRRAPR